MRHLNAARRCTVFIMVFDENSFDLELPQSDVRPFCPDELIVCEACARSNPPNRAACLYCGAPLNRSDGSSKISELRVVPIDLSAAGFDVLISPNNRSSGVDAGTLARVVRADSATIESCINSNEFIPILRVASAAEAEFAEKKLEALGLVTFRVADSELNTDRNSTRIRALDLEDSRMKGRASTGELLELSWDDVTSIVNGRLIQTRVELEERQGRKAGIVDSTETTHDVAVMELHAKSGAPWRITSHDFDYSCLRERKALLASENFGRLLESLREKAPQAHHDDTYNKVRRLLDFAWPVGRRLEAGGLRRDRPGRLNVAKVTVVDNEMQFTRYSRLRNHLVTSGRLSG